MHLHLSTTRGLKEGETIGDVFPGGELNVQCVYVTNPLRIMHVLGAGQDKRGLNLKQVYPP